MYEGRIPELGYGGEARLVEAVFCETRFVVEGSDASHTIQFYMVPFIARERRDVDVFYWDPFAVFVSFRYRRYLYAVSRTGFGFAKVYQGDGWAHSLGGGGRGWGRVGGPEARGVACYLRG